MTSLDICIYTPICEPLDPTWVSPSVDIITLRSPTSPELCECLGLSFTRATSSAGAPFGFRGRFLAVTQRQARKCKMNVEIKHDVREFAEGGIVSTEVCASFQSN